MDQIELKRLKKLGIKIGELAKTANVSRTTIYRIANGKSSGIGTTLKRLKDAQEKLELERTEKQERHQAA